MCLAPVVASTLGTHAIPFSDILPSTYCLYPKDKHHLAATLPAAAILGTPSGFPLACTARVRSPGHSWSRLGRVFTGERWGGAGLGKPNSTDTVRLCKAALPREAEGITGKKELVSIALVVLDLMLDSKGLF